MNDILNDVLVSPAYNKDWHMQLCERIALLQTLQRLSPQVSIEIGTFLRGSLRPIAAKSQYVYTFDIDPNQHRNQDEFDNVTFITGDTKHTLRPVIKEIGKSNNNLEFILIDGSHDESGVKCDIDTCLEYIPTKKPLVILMHDSANPDVRNGILKANWHACPFVHALNLDYIPAMLYDRSDISGQIWGGLAAAVLLPTQRSTDLTIQAPFQHSLNVLTANSVHRVNV